MTLARPRCKRWHVEIQRQLSMFYCCHSLEYVRTYVIWGRIHKQECENFHIIITVLCARCSVLLCLSSGVPWKMPHSCWYDTETLRTEAQTLESRSPNLCSVSLGRPVAVNKGKLDCPGLLDRTVDTICSADTCDHCAITVHSSFVATWELGTHAKLQTLFQISWDSICILIRPARGQ